MVARVYSLAVNILSSLLGMDIKFLLLLVPYVLAIPNLVQRAPPQDRKVIIQLFEWTWDSVAAECTNFIGPAGYGYVQGQSVFTPPTK